MAANMMDESIRITYHCVLPVLVVLGVVGSVSSIRVLCQPALRKAYVNRSVVQ